MSEQANSGHLVTHDYVKSPRSDDDGCDDDDEVMMQEMVIMMK